MMPNSLSQGVDSEAQEAAEDLQSRAKYDDSASESAELPPLDPNLTCFYCNKQFRFGEIQKFKRHVKSCSTSAKSKSEFEAPPFSTSEIEEEQTIQPLNGKGKQE